MANNVVKFLITGDASSLTKAAEQGEQSVTNIGSAGSKTGKLVSAGLLAAGAGLVSFGAESIKVALAGESSQAALDTAIKNTGSSVKAVGPEFDALEAKGAKYGETNDQVRQGLATLTTATGSTKTAEQDLQLTQDISVQKHLSLAAAAKLVGKVEEGNVGSLGRFGLATKDAAGHTLTQAAAMDELRSKFKGAADEFAGTDAGKLAAFHAQFEDLEENVGSKLLPVLTRFGTDAVQGITDVEHAFDGLSGPMKTAVELGVGLAVGAVAISKGYGLVKGVLTDVKGVVSDVTSFAGKMADKFTSGAAESETSIGGIGTSAQGMATETETASTEAGSSLSTIGTAAQTAATEVDTAAGEAAGGISSIGAAATETAGVVEGEMSGLDTTIASIGVSAEESAGVAEAAFTTIGASAEALSAQILAAKEASDVGVWGGGGVAPGGAGGAAADATEGSTLATAGGIGLRTAIGGAALPATIVYLATQGGDQAPVTAKQAQSQAATTFLAKSPSAQQADISSLQRDASESGVSSADEKVLTDKIALYKTLGTAETITTGIQAGFKTSLDNVKGAAIGDVGSFDNLVTAVLKHKGATLADTSAIQSNYLATKTSAAGLKTYGTDLTSTLSPALGAISAEQGLTAAKQNTYLATVALSQATKQYGKDSPQATQAEKDLTSAHNDQITAAVTEQTSLVSLAQTYQAGGKSVDDFKGTLQGLVQQGDITQDEANGLVLSFGLTKAALDKIPTSHNTDLTASGVVPTVSALDNVKSFIGTVPTSHNTVVTADVSQAEGQLSGLAGAIRNVGATYASNLNKGLAAVAFSTISAVQSQPPKVKGVRAEGGPVSTGRYLVGEKGPELLDIFGTGYVTANKELRKFTEAGVASGGTVADQAGSEFFAHWVQNMAQVKPSDVNLFAGLDRGGVDVEIIDAATPRVATLLTAAIDRFGQKPKYRGNVPSWIGNDHNEYAVTSRDSNIKQLLGYRAQGGPVSPGQWVVGEEGPEIIQMQGYGEVIPNHDLERVGAQTSTAQVIAPAQLQVPSGTAHYEQAPPSIVFAEGAIQLHAAPGADLHEFATVVQEALIQLDRRQGSGWMKTLVGR